MGSKENKSADTSSEKTARNLHVSIETDEAKVSIDSDAEGAPESAQKTTDRETARDGERETAAENRPDAEQDPIEKLENEIQELKDKHLRLLAEFENFRRRTARERLELIKTASEDVIVELLGVLDDFERAEKSMKDSTDVDALREGYGLIATKFKNILSQKGVQAMEAMGKDFDPELHEAITEIPAPEESTKGTVLDEVEKGYLLNDKIIRYAKVVVGK